MNSVCLTIDIRQEIKRALEGDELAYERLYSGVRPYAKSLKRRFFIPGAEAEDLEQEALAGFATALRKFDPDCGNSFTDYAMMCMRNSVVAAVRRATRKKQTILNEACSIDASVAPMGSVEYRPDKVVEHRLTLNHLLGELKTNLSSTECRSLMLRVSGLSVEEIARTLDTTEKAIENALFRARKKAKNLVEPAA